MYVLHNHDIDLFNFSEEWNLWRNAYQLLIVFNRELGVVACQQTLIARLLNG